MFVQAPELQHLAQLTPWRCLLLLLCSAQRIWKPFKLIQIPLTVVSVPVHSSLNFLLLCMVLRLQHIKALLHLMLPVVSLIPIWPRFTTQNMTGVPKVRKKYHLTQVMLIRVWILGPCVTLAFFIRLVLGLHLLVFQAFLCGLLSRAQFCMDQLLNTAKRVICSWLNNLLE